MNCLSEYSPSRPFVHILCVFDRTRPKLKLCLSVLERRAGIHFHTHTRALSLTHTLQPGEQRLSCGLCFQHFMIKHVQQFSNSKDCILQQSTTIDLILTLRFGQGGTNARRCEGKEVVLEEMRL